MSPEAGPVGRQEGAKSDLSAPPGTNNAPYRGHPAIFQTVSPRTSVNKGKMESRGFHTPALHGCCSRSARNPTVRLRGVATANGVGALAAEEGGSV